VKGVSGTIDNVITSLVLVTNVKTYGPFGQEKGQCFGETVPENTCVVGFFGKSGAALDALGLYIGAILV
jgi:disease resistance protein RPM1